MTRPILGLLLGLAVLLYAILAYAGTPVFPRAPAFLQRKGDLLWLGGNLLIALALMLGMAGSLLQANLRILRIVLGVAGLLLLFFA